MSELCELCHSLSSESALARLTIPALVEVNLSGEETKSGRLVRASWKIFWLAAPRPASRFAA